MQAGEVDRIQPEGKWEFNAEVADAFDDMLARSIPQYDLMRQSCFDVACRYVRPSTAIVDLGCARGEALAPFIDKFGSYNRYVGVEVSQPMPEAARHRFDGWIKCGIAEIRDLDLRKDYPPVKASVTLSILTLQFTPIEYRQKIVREVYKHTEPGGAFLLVEKVLGGSAELDALMGGPLLRAKGTQRLQPRRHRP